MTPVSLEPDCSQCAALCCVVLAFDRSSQFAENKLAGAPCRHLDDADRCRIHATRTERGYPGCLSFDCQGAGQRVTALFGGVPAARQGRRQVDLMAAFSAMRANHADLEVLRSALALDLPAAVRHHGSGLVALVSEAGDSRDGIAFYAGSELAQEVRDWLHSLRDMQPVRRLRQQT